MNSHWSSLSFAGTSFSVLRAVKLKTRKWLGGFAVPYQLQLDFAKGEQ